MSIEDGYTKKGRKAARNGGGRGTDPRPRRENRRRPPEEDFLDEDYRDEDYLDEDFLDEDYQDEDFPEGDFPEEDLTEDLEQAFRHAEHADSAARDDALAESVLI